jgi:type IV pilus assembly protein PilC
MMTFVVPKLSAFLKAQDFDLPWYTNALIITSDTFVAYWYIIVFGPILLFIGLKLLLRFSEEAAFFMDRFLLSLPIFGTVIRKIELARFCHFFSVTFQSGLGILDCMQVAHNVVHNRVIRESIVAAKRSVAEGSSLAGSLRTTGQFPSLVIRMFKVGEDSGNMEATLKNITFFYDREVNEGVGNMVGFIQPALTIILGGIMLWISLAVFGPLYASFSNLQF